MEMYQIRYFLAVAKTLHFSRAAEECNVSQPALSRAIKSLEFELGGDLFRRERALSHLTELGRTMLPVLQRCFDSSTEAKSLAAAYKKGQAAPLRIALSWSVNLAILVPALTEIVSTFPGLELKFYRDGDEETAENLKRGESEVALTSRLTSPWDRLDSYLLFSEPLQLALSEAHPLAKHDSVDLADLTGHRVFFRKHCALCARLTEILGEHGVEPQPGDEVISDSDIMTLLDSSLGVSFLPSSAVGSALIRSIPVNDLDMECEVFVHSVAGRQRSVVASTLTKLLRAADWEESLARIASRKLPGAAVATAAKRISAKG